MSYQKETQIKIDGEVYTIPYPNVGQQLEIESLKQLLSNGNYNALATNTHKTAAQLLDIIDAVSYFTVLCPALRTKIELKNFTTMDPILQRKLSKAFIKFYTGFVVKVEAEINKSTDEDDE